MQFPPSPHGSNQDIGGHVEHTWPPRLGVDSGRFRERRDHSILEKGIEGRKGDEIMTIIKVRGMTCDHCVQAVTNALNEIDGIRNVSIDLAKGRASFDKVQPVDMEIVREHIKRAGYEVV